MEHWESTKRNYRIALVGGIPLLVILGGALRWRSRKARRQSNLRARYRMKLSA